MTLYTYYQQTNKVVYGTTMNGKCFFFFKGFKSAEEAKAEILAPFTGMEKVWHETALVGEWSEIE